MYVFHEGIIEMFAFAMFMSLCVDVMVMSSAYVVSWSVMLECQMFIFCIVWVIGRRVVGLQFGIGAVLMFCF